MLSKNRRIPKTEFAHILSSGKRYNSAHILLYIAEAGGNTAQNSRFSFSVSKKVAKTAVLRNKLRRRGYSVLSRFMGKVNDGFFLFFSFKKGSDKLSFGSIEKEVFELLSNSGVIS